MLKAEKVRDWRAEPPWNPHARFHRDRWKYFLLPIFYVIRNQKI